MTTYDKEKKSELILLLQQGDRHLDRYIDRDDEQMAKIKDLKEKLENERSEQVLSTARMMDSREVCEKLRTTIKEMNEECEEKTERVVHLNKSLKLYQANLEEAKESIKNLKSTNNHLTRHYEEARDLASNREKMLLDFEMQMEAVKTMISTSLNHYSLNSEVEDSPHWAGFRTIT